MGGVPKDLLGEWQMFRKEENVVEKVSEYLKDKDFTELRALNTAVEMNVLEQVDPFFDNFKLEESKEIIRELLKEEKEFKTPRNLFTKWFY